MSRRCCCDRPCIIVEDDFNRVNNTDLGPKWVEVSGDSEIVSNTLLQIPGPGLVRTVASHPVNHVSGLVYGTAKNLQNGKRYRLIINYVDSSNYVYAEIYCTSSEVATVGIYNMAGGSPTTLAEVTNVGYLAGDEAYMLLCRSNDAVFLDTVLATVIWSCLNDNGGRKAGLANGGSTALEWDDFQFTEHKITNADCPECYCDCDGNCIPKTLTLTVLASGLCACNDGAYTTISYTTPIENCTWFGTLDLDDMWSCEGSIGTWEFTFLRVNGPSGQRFYLCMLPLGIGLCGDPGPCAVGGNGGGSFDYSHTCSPLSVLFGPFSCDTQGGICTYWIQITL